MSSRTAALWLSLVLTASLALPLGWCADDQEQAEKQLRKITALAFDPAARPLVSQAVAEFLKVPRIELMRQRRAANLSYGTVFLAYRLSASGVTLEDIAEQLHQGRTIWEIGNERHADWRKIAIDAKKLNGRIEAAFYDYFRNGPTTPNRKQAEDYDPAKDSVPADQEGLTKQDLAAAQDIYARCFRRARGEGANVADGPDDRNHNPSQTEGDPR